MNDPEAARLFVYGSLAPGRVNEHLLAPLRGSWREATVRGRLVEVGWGAELGYPGILLDPLGPAVEGWVFESADLQSSWQRLDEFEGEDYQRVLAPVTLAGGDTIAAWVYALRRVESAHRANDGSPSGSP